MKKAKTLKGHIAKWFPERGFGFIKPDGAGHDEYLHISKVVEGMPCYGAAVEFKTGFDKSRTFAIDVRIIEEGQRHNERNGITTLYGEHDYN